MYPKPLLFYDHSQNNTLHQPPPASSFLVASSGFSHHVPLQGDHYNNSGMTLIPQSYYRPPEIQTFCLVQDGALTRQQQQHHESFYNITGANSCGLQASKSFTNTSQMSNVGSYSNIATFSNNQLPAVQSTIFSTISPMGFIVGDVTRDRNTATVNLPKSVENKFEIMTTNCATSSRTENANYVTQKFSSSGLGEFHASGKHARDNRVPQKNIRSSNTFTTEEKFSDESTTSLDFTIEAEKMVSELCNTVSSSNMAGKEETKIKLCKGNISFGGTGDDVCDETYWFPDLYADYGNNATATVRKSVETQTHGNDLERQQYPELIRKTAFWGCREAENILHSAR